MAVKKVVRRKAGPTRTRPKRGKASFTTSPEFRDASAAALAAFQKELVSSDDVVRGSVNANLSTVNGRGLSVLLKSADGTKQYSLKAMEVHRTPRKRK